MTLTERLSERLNLKVQDIRIDCIGETVELFGRTGEFINYSIMNFYTNDFEVGGLFFLEKEDLK